MKSQRIILIITLLICTASVAFSVACSVPASAIKLNVEQSESLHKRTIEKPKAEVWKAVSEVLSEQGFSVAKSDKDQGYILTQSQKVGGLKSWTGMLSGVVDTYTTIEVWITAKSDESTNVKASIMETAQHAVGTVGGGPTDPTLGMVKEKSQDNYLAYDPFFDAIGEKLGVTIPHLFRKKK